MIEIGEKTANITYKKLKAGLIQFLLQDYAFNLDPWELLSPEYRDKIQKEIEDLIKENLNFEVEIKVEFNLEIPNIKVDVYLEGSVVNCNITKLGEIID